MTQQRRTPQEELLKLKAEISDIARRSPRMGTAEFTSWALRTPLLLNKTIGSEHILTRSFIDLNWRATSTWPDNGEIVFLQTSRLAEGLLDAAAAEVGWMTTNAGVFNEFGVDPELWAFIAADVEGEHWGKAATQATLFLEDRIRKWADQPPELVGEKLMTAVFGTQGNYRLGTTEGEKEGWHRFAMGIFMALRNANAHRIQDRPDHSRYVLGVIGSCSLLLTQLRYEHAERFHGVSPTPQPGGPLNVTPPRQTDSRD